MEVRQQRADLAVAATLTESALKGERVVSIVRIVFCLAVVGRAAYYWTFTSMALDHPGQREWIVFPAIAVAIAFSIAALFGAGRRRTTLMLHVSVALDALVCFAALLPNALWPGSGYRGTPFVIDTAALLVLAMASGLRHSVSVAALGGLLCAASYGALAIVDHVVSGTLSTPHAGAHVMYGILISAAAVVAIIIAANTRRLVARGARAAIAAEQAGEGLRALLRDHHDLRTVVTSAQLNADLIARRGAGAGANVEHLRDDLDELRRQLEQVKSRALEELGSLEAKQPAEVADAAKHVIAALQPRFPDVTFDAGPDDVPRALVAGGPASLRRILANLVVNACEGNGAHRARRIAISARHAESMIAIEVADDGPGLPAHVLEVPPGQAISTKPIGVGFGIGLVDGLVKASGGRVAWNNGASGGARVVVELPAAG